MTALRWIRFLSTRSVIALTNETLGPYVNFQGRAREAMEFYQKVLGGDLDWLTDRFGINWMVSIDRA